MGVFGGSMKKEPAWIGIVRPPVLAIAFVLKILYTGLLGWWFDPLLARMDDRHLAEEVKQNVPLLFADNVGGRMLPSETQLPRSFDLAVATVSTPDFLIKFTRARGELNVRLASAKPPHKWEDLCDVLRNSASQESKSSSDLVTNASSCAYYSLADIERLLMTYWPKIQNYWIKW
jgi:hypothetical protein